MPNLTISLMSPIKQIERRLIERGDRVTSESLGFIENAQLEFLRLGGKVENSQAFIALENPDGEFDNTLGRAQKVVRDILISSGVKI